MFFHKKVSSAGQSTNPDLIGGDDWNAPHFPSPGAPVLVALLKRYLDKASGQLVSLVQPLEAIGFVDQASVDQYSEQGLVNLAFTLDLPEPPEGYDWYLVGTGSVYYASDTTAPGPTEPPVVEFGGTYLSVQYNENTTDQARIDMQVYAYLGQYEPPPVDA